MGSSPVTATTDRIFELTRHLVSALGSHRDDQLAVAFSGGADSTALLVAARSLCPGVLAVHVDHGLDPGSTRRAQRAATIAAELAVPFVAERPCVLAAPGESPEAAARRVRYEVLERHAATAGIPWILLGHHHDDQVETMLLRWIAGSGLVGLAAMPTRRGRFLRPFLELPRAQLVAAVAAAGIDPVEDPTNRDLAQPRARLRHHLLPALGPEVPQQLRPLLRHLGSLRTRLGPQLAAHLDLRPEPDGASVALAGLAALAPALRSYALQLLAETAGRGMAPRDGARRELERNLAQPRARLRIDAGDGWRFERHGARLCLLAAGMKPQPFAYTLDVPGVCEIPEIALRFGIRPAPPDATVTESLGTSTVLAFAVGDGHHVLLRSRRPGDRFQPLGTGRDRPLSEFLIAQRIRRDLRDRIPILEVDGEIAWIGGVASSETHRAGRDHQLPTWLVEIDPCPMGK